MNYTFEISNFFKIMQVFLQSDLSFSLKPQFLQSFCVDEVRESLLVGFLHHLTATASGFCTGSDVPKFPPTLLLLLSKMCLEFKDTSVHYLVSFQLESILIFNITGIRINIYFQLVATDEMFSIEEYSGTDNIITPESEICENFQKAAQTLLNHYVRLQGLSVSQMLRKSVETRDWLHTIEPRTVRAVMKRVVEDITAIESQVTALYEDSDGQMDRSSDSSRKTHRYLYLKN